jgi:hypothetical protein
MVFAVKPTLLRHAHYVRSITSEVDVAFLDLAGILLIQ